ncbi:TonB-dependent receptor [Desulfoluna spongiiphila]|uniref:Hemoglobin/transferrin/lactoferrin receptor protein n=1 Tax=Desulfoluna spongiiphila TaxID=419481 RepID=A0A1G5H5A4_9BACT|nr:TonB-dependent receptor [Desulfoluna spongiiphila]SCY59055.1 hemoglobin/transferrin/lactoferrin receptor protein [Desulfoluna spongiiphila]
MMRLFSALRSPLITGALSASLILGTAVTTFAEPVETTSEMKVTATRTERELSEIPSSLSVVTEKEIIRHGYTSVADILQDVPGVEIYDQSLSGAKRINIRGESGARVLIMIDGQKITEQKSMDGAPLLIDPNQVERIEVMKGPASVLYGSEAIGGAVNIITKKGGTRPIQASANVTYNSSTEGFEESLALYGSKDSFSYRINGTRSDQGDRETPSGTIEDSGSETTAGSAFFGYEVGKLTVGLNVEDYTSEIESPPTVQDGTPFDLHLPEWTRQKVGLTCDIKDLSTAVPKIHMDAYAQKTEKEFEQRMVVNMGRLGTYKHALDTYNDQKTYGANAQVDIVPAANHYLVAGYAYTHDTLDAESTQDFDDLGGRILPPPPMGPPGPSTDPVTTTNDANMTTHALFLQDEWILPKDILLTFGGRQTWVESELEESNAPGAKVGSTTDSHPVFSGGLTWNGIKGLTLRGNISQGYRFPGLDKLFMGTNHGGRTTLANPDLSPETSTNYEIGARYNSDTWGLDLAVFYNLADDYIHSTPVSGNIYTYDNVDKAKTHGVEASIDFTIVPLHLTPYASGAWMKRKFETEELSTWKTDTPELSGRFGLRYETNLATRPANVWADLWMRAATESELEQTDDDNPGGTTLETKGSWQTLNIAFGSEFGKDRQYHVSLNLNNLLDESYQTARNTLEEAGFHAVARVGVSF